jgi:outer membrane protein, multidrug efflux system
MIRKLFASLALAAVLVAGCTMIPKYTRPAAPIPADWPRGPAYKETSTTQAGLSAADLQWREFFTDAHLQKSSRRPCKTTGICGWRP